MKLNEGNIMENNIRKLRLENGMSQRQVAEKLGVTRSAVSQWESGNFFPRMGMVQRLAGLFGVKVSDIIGDVKPNGDLSYDEAQLLNAYRQLNAKGRARLLEDAKTMIVSGLYAPAKNNQADIA